MSTAVWLALALVAQAPTHHKEAQRLVRRSIFEYDTGAYVKALADIEKAYEIDPRPELLFNVGQCQRVLGHHAEAAIAYKSYLRDLPNASNRALAVSLLAQMEKLSREDDAKAHPPPPPPPPPAPAPEVVPAPVPEAPVAAVTEPESGGHHVPAGAWWLGGSGIAVGAVGTVLYALSAATLGTDHSTPLDGYTTHQLSPGAFNGAATEGNTGEVLWAVGGAALVAGIVVAFTGGGN